MSTVLWTSGYRLDLAWIDLPIFDEIGERGTSVACLRCRASTFLGLPWQYYQGSHAFFGVAADAQFLAERW